MIVPFPHEGRCSVATMAQIPDLVQDSMLDTDFHPDLEQTRHVQYVCTPKQRKLRKEQIWKREKGLGRGGFGIIWLERCIQGDCKGEVRAVKMIRKLQNSNYYRELEAIAIFSRTKVAARPMFYLLTYHTLSFV